MNSRFFGMVCISKPYNPHYAAAYRALWWYRSDRTQALKLAESNHEMAWQLANSAVYWWELFVEQRELGRLTRCRLR